jgi:hypothetical protein
MVIMSKANRMLCQLRALRREQGIVLDPPPILAPLPSVKPPMILAGIASHASTFDADHISMRPRAFGELPPPATIPLRLDHTEVVVGTIETLSYGNDGSLLISARVTDERAVNRPGWSISASIDEYELDERNITAIVVRARLQEISLVQQPACPYSRVTERSVPNPSVEFYSLMLRKVELLTKLVKENSHAHAHP